MAFIDAKIKAPPPPEAHHGSDPWRMVGWLDLANRAINAVRNALPAFTHSIQCAVAGGPNADIRRVWYLCASIVYGRFRNRVRTAFTAVNMAATWDITEKVVSLELSYSANSLTGGFSSSGAGFADPGSCGPALMARGPEQLTIGGGLNTIFNPLVTRELDLAPSGSTDRPGWVAELTRTGCIGEGGDGGPVALYTIRTETYDGSIIFPGVGRETIKVLRELPDGLLKSYPRVTGGTTPGLTAIAYPYRVNYIRFGSGFVGPTFTSPSPFSLPRLPDEQRVITTGEKNDVRVQPPKPDVDGHTRSSLLGLVAAALQTPCFLPAAPPCTKNGMGAGLFVLPKGSPTSADITDMADLWGKRDSFDGKWPLAASQGPDGYPLAPLPPGFAGLAAGVLDVPPDPQVTNYGG